MIKKASDENTTYSITYTMHDGKYKTHMIYAKFPKTVDTSFLNNIDCMQLLCAVKT